jgi:hypothetical protein
LKDTQPRLEEDANYRRNQASSSLPAPTAFVSLGQVVQSIIASLSRSQAQANSGSHAHGSGDEGESGFLSLKPEAVRIDERRPEEAR